MTRPKLPKSEKRSHRIAVTLTTKEYQLVRKAMLGAESISQTTRRLVLDGADADDTRRNLIRHHYTPEPDA